MKYVEKLLDDWRLWILRRGYSLGSDRDELVSEVAIRVYRRAEQEHVCAAYLKEVTKFALIDLQRTRTFAQLPSEEQLPPSARDTIPADLLAAKEQAQEILEFVTPAEREVLLLFCHGNSIREIAAQLGKLPGAVNSTFQRARARVRHRQITKIN